MTLPPFPGEGFLAHSPPKFEEEWKLIIRNVLVATFFFIVLVPSFVKAYYNNKIHENLPSESSPSENESLVDAVSSGNTKVKVRVVTRTFVNGKDQGTTAENNREQPKKKIKLNSKKADEETHKGEEGKKTNKKEDEDAKVPGFVFPLINVVYLACLVILIAKSPNNTTTARRVFLAPLLKKEETKMIIDMATNAAEHCAQMAKDELARISICSAGDAKERETISLKKILEWPVGYKKDR